ASDFLHRLQTATHGPIAPVVKKSSRPDHGFVAPEVGEGFLQLPGASRGQLGVKLLPGPSTDPAAPAQQRPAHVLELLRLLLAVPPQACALGAANLIYRLVQVGGDMETIQHV